MNNNYGNSLRQLFQLKPDLRTNFTESQYVSKNKHLIRILTELTNDNYVLDDTVYKMIRENKWRELDAFILEHPGASHFFRLLQQLLLYKYFLPKEEQVTRKQFETAMGIQQVRWMVDDENCKEMQNYKVEAATFTYFDDIPEDEKRIILKELYKEIRYKLYNKQVDLSQFLVGTVWYNVLLLNSWGEQTAAGWSGYGPKKCYYPITETLNFSKISCIYVPKLLFGSLSDSSLLKFIILHAQRPYAAHLPSSSSNLCIIHSLKHCIVANWIHDFHHSRSGECRIDYNFVNRNCGFVEKDKINENNIISQIQNTSSPLSLCLANSQEISDACDKELNVLETARRKAESEGSRNKAEEISKEWFKLANECGKAHWIRAVNDTGTIWHTLPLRVFEGGAKKSRKRKEHKKTKTTRRNKNQ